MTEELKPEAALEALAEVLCTERCAQAGDPPCSKAAPGDPHCDECLGMAQAVIEHRAKPEAAPVEPVAWMYTDEEGGRVACVEQIEPPFEGWTETALYAHPPAAPTDALVEALREMFEAVCGETGFAQAVRAESGLAYPWPALDLAEAKARAALAAMQEPKQ